MESNDDFVSPSEVAEVDAAAAGEDGLGIEGEASSEPSEPWYWRSLRSTEPNPPLSEVGDLRDIRSNWQAYGMRGVQKLGNIDDAEAWVDLLKFVIGLTVESLGGLTEGNAEPDGEDDPLGDLGV
jgi:hypothetical protein